MFHLINCNGVRPRRVPHISHTCSCVKALSYTLKPWPCEIKKKRTAAQWPVEDGGFHSEPRLPSPADFPPLPAPILTMQIVHPLPCSWLAWQEEGYTTYQLKWDMTDRAIDFIDWFNWRFPIQLHSCCFYTDSWNLVGSLDGTRGRDCCTEMANNNDPVLLLSSLLNKACMKKRVAMQRQWEYVLELTLFTRSTWRLTLGHTYWVTTNIQTSTLLSQHTHINTHTLTRSHTLGGVGRRVSNVSPGGWYFIVCVHQCCSQGRHGWQ